MMFECKLTIPPIYPCREASSREEFIENLIWEYNGTCSDLFEIEAGDISEVEGEEEEE